MMVVVIYFVTIYSGIVYMKSTTTSAQGTTSQGPNKHNEIKTVTTGTTATRFEKPGSLTTESGLQNSNTGQSKDPAEDGYMDTKKD